MAQRNATSAALAAALDQASLESGRRMKGADLALITRSASAFSSVVVLMQESCSARCQKETLPSLRVEAGAE
jgi:hypothetical protein